MHSIAITTKCKCIVCKLDNFGLNFWREIHALYSNETKSEKVESISFKEVGSTKLASKRAMIFFGDIENSNENFVIVRIFIVKCCSA